MRTMARALMMTAVLGVAAWAGPAAAGDSAAAAGASCPLPVFGPGASYHPVVQRSGFTAEVTNPWFPLPPGTTYLYTGVKDGKRALDVFMPSRRTRVVDGVTTRVVEDRLFLDGVLVERTSDYYAQDRCGNVWYFGEDTAELDANGRVVDTSGSFHAGVDGAQPGVFMQARPQVGRPFRQEWYPGEAQDVFSAVSASAAVTVPYGSFRNALRTSETTALEPGVLDAKYYVRGLGEVAELSLKGPLEQLRLVEVLR